MSVTIKRNCNASVKKEDEKITFSSWSIILTKEDLTNFRRIKDIFDRENRFSGLPDREAKILELMLEIGMMDYLKVKA